MADQAEARRISHSGAFVFSDQVGHIRGVYDGTKADQVDRSWQTSQSFLLNEAIES